MNPFKENIAEVVDFQSLMQQRIERILLVCSSYDQFTLEEDGRLNAQIKQEYSELSLSNPPQFFRVASGEEALEELARKDKYDLIITMFNIGKVSPFELSVISKSLYPKIPIVLLTSFSHEVSRRLENENTSGLDYVFGWQGNTDLLMAIIKMLEDAMNADRDILESGVQAILLVEDSIRFYSAYLPDLYYIVIHQTHAFATEALNEQQRTMRKRARPKILFARTYNEALEVYNKFKSNLLGVISDVSFVREKGDKELYELAGVDLAKIIKIENPMTPVLLQSSNGNIHEIAAEIGADFINKNSKTLLDELQQFIANRLAFGDFLFVNRSGVVVATVSDLAQMQQAIETLPDEVLLDYSAQNMFSKWLYARGLFAVASLIRDVNNSMFSSAQNLRNYLADVIKNYRRQMGQGVIAEFITDTYNKYITFARSGSGSLGGKARGLAFIENMLEQHDLYTKWDGVRITIPRTIVIATDHFDEFISRNRLHYIMHEKLDDNEILNEFVGSSLSEVLLEHIRVFVKHVKRPLAVRSSSKLEDSHYQPFAGVYSTYMVPRTDNLERQVRMVAKAIKSVYASIFFHSSRSYIEATSNVLSEEKMAVVIQEICGTEDCGYYFPTISGVAQSLNFYPIGDEKPEEGVCNIALGMGKMVVEGGVTMRFSPRYPKHALQLSSAEIALRDTQRQFYALDLNPASLKTSTDDSINLVKMDVNKSTHFRNMKYVASTWDANNQSIVDTFNEKGRKLITFAHILKFDTFPLADIITELLTIGENEMKSPVEIEFAVNLDVPAGDEKIFNFLQIRPIVYGGPSESIEWDNVSTDDALIYAESALGLGLISGLYDLIYVRPDHFNPANSVEIATEIGMLNEKMKGQERNYILVGPGRWGSSDPWLGIPVKWTQISESLVIAECGLENFRVDPSQGTHFFQNLTSFGVGYLTLNPCVDDGVFNVEQLDQLEAVYESENIRHVHFDEMLYVFIDGANNKGVVKKSKN